MTTRATRTITEGWGGLVVSLIEQVRPQSRRLKSPVGRVLVIAAGIVLIGVAATGLPGRLAALIGVCLLCARAYGTRRPRLFALVGSGLAIAGTVLRVGRLLPEQPEVSARFAAGLEVLSAVLLLPATVIGVCLGVTLLGRAVRRPADFSWIKDKINSTGVDDASEPNVVPSPSVLGPDGRAFPGDALPTPVPGADLGRPAAALGICASGGGIRSASLTLGALQSLRSAGLLRRARYLVSVSGGGFTAGAFQLAMNPLPVGDRQRHGEAVTDPELVFAEGSVEEDHIRRHGKYVADSAGEWVVALGALMRGAGASLALLAGVVCCAGAVLGAFYRVSSVAVLDYGYPFSPGTPRQAPPFPGVPDPVLVAFLIPALFGVVTWFVVIGLMSYAGTASRRGRYLMIGSFSVAAAVLVIGAGVPLVVWAGTRAIWWVDSVSSLDAGQLVTGGAAGTMTLAYLGSLSSILWRDRTRIAGIGRFFGGQGVLKRLPSALSQRITVWSVLLAIGALYALLFGAVVRSVSQRAVSGGPVSHWGAWPQWFLVAACGIFVLVTAFVDETWMSLHGFYRRRLATAFSVRRLRLGEGSEAALPYDFEGEQTRLSIYGARREGFPQVIFSAAAHLSGADRSPPGRNAVSFSFSSDWVGGPQVGYVRTGALEDNLGPNLRMDLTVQTAVAVSGAAFASSMGVQARAYQTLLALSNARLGTWLPNPAWLYRRGREARAGADWTQPRLPRIRRISYLLREVLGVYDQRHQLLLVTDGGHYDNTGLVEMLRHRCRTIVLIDASGDSPPFAQALARAISLAREELDVRVDLRAPLDLAPGSGDSLGNDTLLAPLSARLSKAAVVVGTITYPEEFLAADEPVGSTAGAVGHLVVAKLALTADMPYDVMAFAGDNPAFPFDSTNDQWFDESQFNGYHALGRVLGERAAQAVVALVPSPDPGPASPPAAAPAPAVPTEAVPTEAVPTEAVPPQRSSAEDSPAQQMTRES